MAVSKQQLAQIIGKARDLCSPNGDRLVESYKGQGPIDGNDPDPSQYNDYDEFDRMYLNEDTYQEQRQTSKKNRPTRDIVYNEQTAMNSRMRDDIKESMLNNVIDASALANQSVLDGMDIPVENRPQQRKQPIREQKYTAPQVSGVDYSIIKAIVNECLNEYFSRKPINESANLTTIGLKKGAIKLVDSQGNVYSANLEKIGNTKNK